MSSCRPAEDAHVAHGWSDKAHGQVEEGGLVGAIGTNQSYHPSGRDGEAAVAKGPPGAVALAESRRL